MRENLKNISIQNWLIQVLSKKKRRVSILIHSENKTDLLLTQKGDQFYYYFDNDEVYLLKNLDKAPSSILTD